MKASRLRLVLISVPDEGGGIPPEKMANIFSDPLTPEKEFVPHGLRLGLPLAKGLTELQGGNLLAENAVACSVKDTHT